MLQRDNLTFQELGFLLLYSFIIIQMTRNIVSTLRCKKQEVRVYIHIYPFFVFAFSLPTYRFSPAEEELVPCQGVIAGLPALDELPADLFLLQLPFDQRLSFLVHD